MIAALRSGRVVPVLSLLALTALALALPALVIGDAINGDIPVHVRWQWQFPEQV